VVDTRHKDLKRAFVFTFVIWVIYFILCCAGHAEIAQFVSCLQIFAILLLE